MPGILHLTNDDEPARLARRNVSIRSTDLMLGDVRAAVALVDPPLAGNGWGSGTSTVVLVSRTQGVSIQQIIDEPDRRPARVIVCRFLGDINRMPKSISRADVSIEFWGLLE
jgi:hypothetical protein